MMTLRNWMTTGMLAVAIASLPAIAPAATAKQCATDKTATAMENSQAVTEANDLLNSLDNGLMKVARHASTLENLSTNLNVSSEAHSSELSRVRADINRMGDETCRLEAIRQSVAPWQRQAIDRADVELRLIAANTDNAIVFLNASPQLTWTPTYRSYVTNLYNESSSLARSVRRYEHLARVQSKDRNLEKSLGMKSGS